MAWPFLLIGDVHSRQEPARCVHVPLYDHSPVEESEGKNLSRHWLLLWCILGEKERYAEAGLQDTRFEDAEKRRWLDLCLPFFFLNGSLCGLQGVRARTKKEQAPLAQTRGEEQGWQLGDTASPTHSNQGDQQEALHMCSNFQVWVHLSACSGVLQDVNAYFCAWLFTLANKRSCSAAKPGKHNCGELF